MTATQTKKMTTINVFLHQWTDINAENYPEYLSPERAETNWSDRPKALTVPEGWHVSMSGGGSLEIYTADGQHVQFVRMADHRKSAEFAWSGGHAWFAVADAESVCCPTCGHEM